MSASDDAPLRDGGGIVLDRIPLETASGHRAAYGTILITEQ
jgi:hypothetical protein